MPNPSVMMNPTIDKKNPFAEKTWPPPEDELIPFSTTDYDENNLLGATKVGHWGEPSCLVGPEEFPLSWIWSGINFFCEREALLVSRCEIYKVTNEYRAIRKSGKQWNLGETKLTVNKTNSFEIDDLVWIRSKYKPHGEILTIGNIDKNAVVVKRGNRVPLRGKGLRWNHSGESIGTEEMYLIKRVDEYETAQFDLSVNGFKRIAMVNEKGMLPGHGLIIRGANGLNSERRNLLCSIIWCM